MEERDNTFSATGCRPNSIGIAARRQKSTEMLKFS